ncbi:MAG: protein-L-isoaspartate O-methyltransferase, partial [Bacteroidota bacterium]
ASPKLPQPLLQQLEIGGHLVAPVGPSQQQRMQICTRLAKNEFQVKTLQQFQFVPLRGRHGYE